MSVKIYAYILRVTKLQINFEMQKPCTTKMRSAGLIFILPVSSETHWKSFYPRML